MEDTELGTSHVTSTCNVWTFRWVPLRAQSGERVWASPLEILTGGKDAPGLDYPRDDFDVYARLLLSALVQAAIPAKSSAELVQRMAVPLTRAEVEPILNLPGFDLFGPNPWLQHRVGLSKQDGERLDRSLCAQLGLTFAVDEENDKTGAFKFVLDPGDIFVERLGGVSLQALIVILYAEQMYSSAAGTGYGPGPGRQIGTITLINTGSVRTSIWANTLSLETAQQYPTDPQIPWGNKPFPKVNAELVGLVQGLFFQPRGIQILPTGSGVCSYMRERTPLFGLSAFCGKSSVEKNKSAAWRHPCSPYTGKASSLKLGRYQPVWLGFAQMLPAVTGSDTKLKKHAWEGPSLTLQQWASLQGSSGKARDSFRKLNVRRQLLVLDFARKNANVLHRMFEGFPVSDAFLQHPDVLDHTRDLIEQASRTMTILKKNLWKVLQNTYTTKDMSWKEEAIRGELRSAHNEYWAGTEQAFRSWLSEVLDLLNSDDNDEALCEARKKATRAFQIAAKNVFDNHAEKYYFAPGRQSTACKALSCFLRELSEAA